jgi:hypothetical protein
MSAANVGGELGGGMRLAGAVGIGEPGLLAVGSGKPAEEMVEAAVLHHDQDDVFDLRGFGSGQRLGAGDIGLADVPVRAAADATPATLRRNCLRLTLIWPLPWMQSEMPPGRGEVGLRCSEECGQSRLRDQLARLSSARSMTPRHFRGVGLPCWLAPAAGFPNWAAASYRGREGQIAQSNRGYCDSAARDGPRNRASRERREGEQPCAFA